MKLRAQNKTSSNTLSKFWLAFPVLQKSSKAGIIFPPKLPFPFCSFLHSFSVIFFFAWPTPGTGFSPEALEIFCSDETFNGLQHVLSSGSVAPILSPCKTEGRPCANPSKTSQQNIRDLSKPWVARLHWFRLTEVKGVTATREWRKKKTQSPHSDTNWHTHLSSSRSLSVTLVEPMKSSVVRSRSYTCCTWNTNWGKCRGAVTTECNVKDSMLYRRSG